MGGSFRLDVRLAGDARVVGHLLVEIVAPVGAAAVGGFLAGAAVASAARPAVVVNPAPVVINSAPVYVGSPMIGTTVSVLPQGCSTMDVNGTHYYQLGSTWYRPYFGGSGVYYQVVAAP